MLTDSNPVQVNDPISYKAISSSISCFSSSYCSSSSFAIKQRMRDLSLLIFWVLFFMPRSLNMRLKYFLIVLKKWSLTMLSVFPSKNSPMLAHLLPNFLWAIKIIFSSFSDQGSLFILGSKWLWYLSRHYFPERPSNLNNSLILAATIVHFLIPYYFTN